MAEVVPALNPPLWMASMNGVVDEVRRLLQEGYGAYIEERWGERGHTALHKAVIDSHSAVVLLLLDNGAEVSAIDNGGETPLHTAVCLPTAAREGHEALVVLLLERGADAMAKTGKTLNPKQQTLNPKP